MPRLVRILEISAIGLMVLVGIDCAECFAATARVHIGLVQRWGEDAGSGLLFYRGHHRYRIIVKGIRFEPTPREVDLVGTATNLRTPADVEGSYHTENEAPAILTGTKSTHMQNEKGATLELHLKHNGHKSTVDLTGMTIVGRF